MPIRLSARNSPPCGPPADGVRFTHSGTAAAARGAMLLVRASIRIPSLLIAQPAKPSVCRESSGLKRHEGSLPSLRDSPANQYTAIATTDDLYENNQDRDLWRRVYGESSYRSP